MKQLSSFSILLFTFVLLFLAPNLAKAEFIIEATEIPYQINNSDRIAIGTVSGIDIFPEHTIVTIRVDEWLYNPFPANAIKVITNMGTNSGVEDEAEFSVQNESVLLMLNDLNLDQNLFRVTIGFPGKHPVSDRDAVIEELIVQGKWKGEYQTRNTSKTEGFTFGPGTFDKLKKDPNFIAAYGNIPLFITYEERKQWLDTLDQIYSESNLEMSKYVYPNGPVINYSYTIDGVLNIEVNKTVEKPFMDEIYQIFDSKAGLIRIKEVPVVFMREDLVVPVDETAPVKETVNSSKAKAENNGEINNSNNLDSEDSGSSGEGNSSAFRHTPGFEILGSLTCLYIGWKLRKK